MLVYKIYHLNKFEKIHKDFFNLLLGEIKKQNYLSPSIDEIIITDNIDKEIEHYCTNRFRQPNLTRTREYKAIAKTVDFDGKKKIFFDANYINGYVKYTPQIFFEQIIEVYAEDIVSLKLNVSKIFHPNTPFSELVNGFFSQWATKEITNIVKRALACEYNEIHGDVKMFVDAFKRNIRKLHYQYQMDLDLGTFWIKVVTEMDYFVRRCLDVKSDKGDFANLQEFKESIPPLLSEVEVQTRNLIYNKEIDIKNIRKYALDLLKVCSIDVVREKPMDVRIIETPKKLFKGNIIDTEPRIVAFIDILGFSAIIAEYDSDKTSNILNELHDTLEMAVKISIENIIDSKAQTDLKEFLEYRMFSDCICISLPYIEFGNDFHIQFHSLATVVKSYQLAMMQKGFFVRGGISIGSFFADKHMIFSGGLVSAYKLEQTVGYPVVAIDKNVIERLSKEFVENSKDLFYENMLIYSESDPNKVFLNPFDILDNSTRYMDYIQSSLDNLINENYEDTSDVISELTNSMLKLTNSFTKPIFDFAKAELNPENMNLAKEEILKQINEQIKKNSSILYDNTLDEKSVYEINKIISKYEYLKALINWSIGKAEANSFKYYDFI